jgi:protein CpxP
MKSQTALTTRALKTPFSPRLKFWLASGVLAVAAGMGANAIAMPHGGAHQGGHHGGQHQGRGMHEGMGGHGMMMMGSPRHLERMLDHVKATPEQKTQIKQIAEAARADLQTQREAGKALREQSRALLVQPTVDARAAETLRQQMLAQHDQASKRMLQATLDISRVLTLEQRQTLANTMAQRQAMMEKHRSERAGVEKPQR